MGYSKNIPRRCTSPYFHFINNSVSVVIPVMKRFLIGWFYVDPILWIKHYARFQAYLQGTIDYCLAVFIGQKIGNFWCGIERVKTEGQEQKLKQTSCLRINGSPRSCIWSNNAKIALNVEFWFKFLGVWSMLVSNKNKCGI